MTARIARVRVGPLILGGLVVLMLALAALAAESSGSSQVEPPYPTYNVHSSSPDGTRAFSLWLSAMGYQSRTLEYQTFHLSGEEKMLFILFPSEDPSGVEASTIVDWVEQGGTLVFATGRPSPFLRQLELSVIPNGAGKTSIEMVEPSLAQPPVPPETVTTYGTLKLGNPSWIPVLNDQSSSDTIGVVRAVGQGQVFAFTTGDMFSNRGLAQPGNRNLTLNILSRIPPGSPVIVDEYHHGFTEQGTFSYQLLRQPWGWAILYLAVAVFAFIALTGRRFGHVVRPNAHALRRARSEFATTLASMLHQNRQREWLRRQYLQQFKRGLGARFRVPASVSTASFVDELARRRPEASALATPLARLEAEQVPDEATLVALLRESETIAARLMEPRFVEQSNKIKV